MESDVPRNEIDALLRKSIKSVRGRITQNNGSIQNWALMKGRVPPNKTAWYRKNASYLETQKIALEQELEIYLNAQKALRQGGTK
jgi:hypothetical protein